jgi:multimeric flavodoxin WrbA
MKIVKSGLIRVWGINGSPQKNGLCVRLLKRVLEGSHQQGAKIRLVHLADYENTLFRLGHVKRPPKKLRTLLDQIRKSADCLILATPVHWFGVSSLMKCFIDHLSYLEYDRPRSNYFELEGKVVSFVATANEDGGLKAVLDMAGPLNQMGAIIPPYATFFHNRNMAEKSEERWMLRDPELLGRIAVQTAEVTRGIRHWGRAMNPSKQ